MSSSTLSPQIIRPKNTETEYWIVSCSSIEKIRARTYHCNKYGKIVIDLTKNDK